MDSPSNTIALRQTAFGHEKKISFQNQVLKMMRRIFWGVLNTQFPQKLGQNQFQDAYNNKRHRSHAIAQILRNKNKKTQRSISQETQAKVRHI